MPTGWIPGMGNLPSPSVTESEVDAFAHCGNPVCPGYGQQPVKAVKTLVERSYQSSGGDWAFTESSSEHLRFADEDERACEHCGLGRMVTLQKRPVYQPLSGHPQNGLLAVKRFDPQRGNTAVDEKAAAEAAELRAQVDALTEQVAALAASGTGEDG